MIDGRFGAMMDVSLTNEVRYPVPSDLSEYLKYGCVVFEGTCHDYS